MAGPAHRHIHRRPADHGSITGAPTTEAVGTTRHLTAQRISFTNRLQRRFAGKPGAYASVIRHQGRRSGRSYETPIVPFATGDGFVVSLPYGPTADWVENVLALGSAVLIHEGRTLTVDRPEVVPVAQVEDLFPPSEQRTHRLFRVEHCLRLRRVEVHQSASGGDERS
jgi:hypothetical protein